MKRINALLLAVFATAFCISAGLKVQADTESPAPAAIVIKKAVETSATKKKPVLVIFHASWCGWCKKLEAALAVPANKKIIEDNFVVTYLDVMESGAKVKTDENPGGNEYLAKMGGAKSGIPFLVFLDAKGKKLGDTNVMPKEQNIGYPGEDGEIVAFEALIKKVAPKMSDADRTTLITYFKENKPKTH